MVALLAFLLLAAQAPATVVHGTVADASGAAVVRADVRVPAAGAGAATVSGPDGSWTLRIAQPLPIVVVVSAPGFASVSVRVERPASAVHVVLSPQGIAEHVAVPASAERLAVSSSATILDAEAVALTPALMVDDALRLVPGFSLFRRTSSRVANPTTQGVTLRGLSASGASRTLVVADGVPLNDPFGAWVYWDRVPVAAIDRIEVARGAASDVHGNDALGGVISIVTRDTPGVELRFDGGQQQTSRASGYAAASAGPATVGVAAEAFHTDGYVGVAEDSRGPIDVPAGSTSRTMTAWAEGSRGPIALSARGGYFDEDRTNGTPAQVNATVSRWAAASGHGPARRGFWDARGDWTGTDYRQTFSAVAASRASERLTNLQWVASSGTGGTVTWLGARGRTTALASASTRYWRAHLTEQSIPFGGGTVPPARTVAWQRADGFAGQARFDVSPRVLVEGGLRLDVFRSRKQGDVDGRTDAAFDPRVAVSWNVRDGDSLRVSWLSGFRGPTMNELFRSFRVGNTVTAANAALEPERTWGPEAAYTIQRDRWTFRGIFYASKLAHAIYNRTVSVSDDLIMRQRSNGDARAVGSELELEWRPARALTLRSSWAVNDSRFTSGELSGRRIPQVPRVQGSVGARYVTPRMNASADVRVFGSQFDDDLNAFALRAGSVTDARVGWTAAARLEIFAVVENAFDAVTETGRTPLTTIGTPRTVRIGARLRF